MKNCQKQAFILLRSIRIEGCAHERDQGGLAEPNSEGCEADLAIEQVGDRGILGRQAGWFSKSLQ